MIFTRDCPPAGLAWKPVLELAARITADESKDLQVVSWWIEGLLRVHGFAGLRDGFRLARELIEAFWDNLYPLPDEEDSSPEEPWATRVGPLAGLNGVESDGVLVNPLLNLPITAAGSQRAMSLVDYQQASELENIQDPCGGHSVCRTERSRWMHSRKRSPKRARNSSPASCKT